jgi:hypothetical protein
MEINKLKEKLEAPMVQARYQYAIDVMLTRLRMIDADLTGKNERPLIRNLCSAGQRRIKIVYHLFTDVLQRKIFRFYTLPLK